MAAFGAILGGWHIAPATFCGIPFRRKVIFTSFDPITRKTLKMATRKRKEVVKKLPAFKMTRLQQEEEDLKKVKAQVIKELEESKENAKEWLDKELDKNLKKL